VERVNKPNDNEDYLICVHGRTMLEQCDDCMMGRNSDPLTGTLAHLGCADTSIPADQCSECAITADAELEVLEPDDPNVVRLRNKRDRLTQVYGRGTRKKVGPSTGRISMGEVSPPNMERWRDFLAGRPVPVPYVSRETPQIFTCSHRGQVADRCTLCGSGL